MKDWEAVTTFALDLPGTELSTSYGRPAVKVRGKAFLYPGREPGSFALSVPIPDKEMLMETEPETFWETDHYRGWPAILVRYGSPSGERIRMLIERAWWDRADTAQRSQRGERP